MKRQSTLVKRSQIFVTHELGHKNDYFFHVKDAPGGHILVKTEFLDEALLRTSRCLLPIFLVCIVLQFQLIIHKYAILKD